MRNDKRWCASERSALGTRLTGRRFVVQARASESAFEKDFRERAANIDGLTYPTFPLAASAVLPMIG